MRGEDKDGKGGGWWWWGETLKSCFDNRAHRLRSDAVGEGEGATSAA